MQIHSLISSLVDLLLPPLCPACLEPVRPPGKASAALCSSCWNQIIFITPPFCDRLGIPLPFDAHMPHTGTAPDHPGKPALSARALAHPPVFARARFAGLYEGTLRTLIHHMKFRDRTDMLPLFGTWLAMAGTDILPRTDLLIPVPLHKSRLRARRFNQSALLATALLHRLKEMGRTQAKTLPKSPHDNQKTDRGPACQPLALQRIKATQTQIGKSRSQRRANVSAAFHVPERYKKTVARQRITLIDDVMTTGSTADACARALLKAGALEVNLLALACVYDPAGGGLFAPDHITNDPDSNISGP